MLQTFPVLSELRAHFPDAQIDWVVERPSASLLEAHPQLSNTLVLDSKKWRRAPMHHRSEIRAFFKRLRSTHYDLLFDLQGNAKSGLITLLAKAEKKIGYSWKSLPEKINALTTHQRIDVSPNLDVRSRYLHLIRSTLGDAPQHPSLEKKREASSNFKLMVCFGSNWKNKQLTDEQLDQLLEKIHVQYEPAFIFIYGGAVEEKRARELAAKFPDAEALGGMTLLEWQQKMKEVDLVFAMDSAALHLAATVDTPTFSLFGPSSMQAYKPPGQQHRALQGSCPYNIKFDKRCPRLRTCETGACLRALSVDEIFTEFSRQQMLKSLLRL